MGRFFIDLQMVELIMVFGQQDTNVSRFKHRTL